MKVIRVLVALLMLLAVPLDLQAAGEFGVVPPPPPAAGETVCILTTDQTGQACEYKACPAGIVSNPLVGTDNGIHLCCVNDLWEKCNVSGGAPDTATYIVQGANAGLANEQSLGLLTTGLLLNTVAASTGVLSTFSPSAACTNQFVTALSASGAATCTSIADASVPDTITVSNYLLLAGGTMTGELTTDDTGIEFAEGDALTDCSTFSATDGGIFYDDSENKFKKCQNNTLTDLDTVNAIPAMYFDKSISSPGASENATVAWVENAITVVETDCVLMDADGTASVTIEIHDGTDRSADGTTNDTIVCNSMTTGVSDGTPAVAAVPAGRWLFIKTTASSGTPTELHVSIRYTEP